MGKRVPSRGMPGLAVALGVTALGVLLLWGGGGSGLAQENNYIFLPLVLKSYPPLFLEDHFDTDADNWTPYTDYWRLKAAQWFWDANGGHQGGGYRHNRYLGGAEAEDALSMYLVGNSQEWVNYRYQAKVNLVSGNVIGLWFRGTYEQTLPGRRFTGYYCTINPDGNRVTLSRMRLEDECANPPCVYAYDFRNPLQLEQVTQDLYRNRWYTLKVEVQGSLIKCYVDDVLKIEYNDTVSGFLQGTVGFYVYKAGDARFDDVLVESL